MDVLKTFVSGVVIIGLVTAVGLHGSSLATAAKGGGAAGANLLNAAEKPSQTMPVVDFSAGNGVAFLIGVTAMSDIIAKACSSPQTVHINADKRADTLMQWVTVGLVEGGLLIAIAAAIDKRHAYAIIAGGAIEAAITFGEYQYAKKAGLASNLPGTEGQTEAYYGQTA